MTTSPTPAEKCPFDAGSVPGSTTDCAPKSAHGVGWEFLAAQALCSIHGCKDTWVQRAELHRNAPPISSGQRTADWLSSLAGKSAKQAPSKLGTSIPELRMVVGRNGRFLRFLTHRP
jgi:hypothetical protein